MIDFDSKKDYGNPHAECSLLNLYGFTAKLWKLKLVPGTEWAMDLVHDALEEEYDDGRE